MKFKNPFRKAKADPPQEIKPFRVGNWVIEVNLPWGFVVKNSCQREEYHFLASSNGWVTGRSYQGRAIKNAAVEAFNSMGVKMLATQLVDKQSTKILSRIVELKTKRILTPHEQEELLILTGIRQDASVRPPSFTGKKEA